MKSILILLVLAFSLCSCNSSPWGSSWQTAMQIVQKSTAEASVDQPVKKNVKRATVYFGKDDQVTSMSLRKLNRRQSKLSLVDSKIVFPRLSSSNGKSKDKSVFYEIKDNAYDDSVRTKITTLCSQNNLHKVFINEKIKYPNKNLISKAVNKDLEEIYSYEIASKDLRFEFNLLELFSESFLSQKDNSQFVCSFFFEFHNEGEITNYIISLKQVEPIYNEINLDRVKLKTSNGQVRIDRYTEINRHNIDQVFLPIKSNFSDDLFLSCSNMKKSILLEQYLMEGIVYSLHSYKDLANINGVQSCRIVSKKLGLVKGMTQLFQVDFDSIKDLDKQLDVDISKLAYSIKEIEYSDSRREKYPGLARNYQPFSINDHFSQYVFQITGLPSDFRSKNYKDAYMEVKTSCQYNEILDAALIESSYVLPLMDEFSVMSVTPEMFFQKHYGYKKLGHKNIYSKSFECAYEVKFKDSSGKSNENKKESNNEITKNSYSTEIGRNNSYGVSIEVSNSKKNSGYVSLLDLFGEGAKDSEDRFTSFNLLFLSQSNDVGFQDKLYPDTMALSCAETRKDSTNEFFMKKPIKNLSPSLPFSTVFTHPKFRSYVEKHRSAACRLLFYKNNILMYFSSALQM